MAQITLNVPADWKTTLWGIVGAILVAGGQYIETGAVTKEGLALAVMIAIKGYISADKNSPLVVKTVPLETK
jgi:hypothetical protein